jgi:hypothetical protein
MRSKWQLFSLIFILNGYYSAGQVTLNLHVLIEGYYSDNGLMDNHGAGGCLFLNGISNNSNDADTITISLANPSNLQTIEMQKGILKTNGTISLNFQQVSPGTSCYIRIDHRNALETWSSLPALMQALTVYDFTLADSMASGNNMIESADHHGWMIFSGDISDANNLGLGVCYQDFVIEGQDYFDMENAQALAVHGYACEDITGDGMVNASDSIIMDDAVRSIRFTHPPDPISVNELAPVYIKQELIKCICINGQLNFQKNNLDLKSTYSLFNINGQLLFRATVGELKDENHTIHIRDGVYLIRPDK